MIAPESGERFRSVPSPLPSVRLWLLDLAAEDAGAGPVALDDQDRELAAGLGSAGAQRLRVRRELLGLVVARVTPCAPADVRIVRDDGPRRLRAGTGAWYYSSSSSGGRGLLALSEHPVGVDLERRPGPPDALLVSSQLLPTAEHDWIARGGPATPERFLRTWVRKEAVVKCTGEGMSRDLRSFTVDAASTAAAVLGPDGLDTGLRTYGVLVPGHAAALATGAPSLSDGPFGGRG